MNLRKFTLIFISFYLPTFLLSQTNFTNRNDLLTATSGFHSGVGVAIADMNNDHLDDIVVLEQGHLLILQLQQANGSFIADTIADVASGSEWSMCVADVNNDGFNDVLTGGYYDKIKVTTHQPNGTYLTTAFDSNIFLQGSNFNDINNDGFVDIFACHDDGAAHIFMNDGTGVFTQSLTAIDLNTVPASDNSGNYGTLWTDFDNDGDVDLYIAKCRQGVNDPTDPRRINLLYVNDGTGHYTEKGAEYNVRIGAQSWTADWNDIDNDGDMDCFITNHDVPSMLLINDGTGHMTDITSTSGISFGELPIEGVMRDFDNDGFNDIMIAGSHHAFYHNNGNHTFTRINNIFNEGQNMESYAIGDINHDGFPDIYGSYAQIYTSPTTVDDVLWLNNGNSNHWLGVNLVGMNTNKMGIGARITIHGPWGVQVREVRAGESYGINNAHSQTFGLGANTTVDKVSVHWPDGHVDVLENISADQYLTITEGSCNPSIPTISANGPTLICPGQNVTLTSSTGDHYLWSNGGTSQSITVSQPGNYNVITYDNNGCASQSVVTLVQFSNFTQPAAQALGELRFCQGQSVTLHATDGTSWNWSNGGTSQDLVVTQTGDYSFVATTQCGQVNSANTIHVDVLAAAPLPLVSDITVNQGESPILNATGSNLVWFETNTSTDTLFAGNSFSPGTINSDTSFFVQGFNIYQGNIEHGGQIDHEGTDYAANTFNAQVLFNVLKPCVLKSVKVYTDVAGIRIIEIRDNVGTLINSKSVDIPVGESIVNLNFSLIPGTDYNITTNAANNTSVFGYVSPRLKRSDTGVSYPYPAGDLLSITGNNLGATRFYFFYDWNVSAVEYDCGGNRVPVHIHVHTSGVQGLNDLTNFSIYPNPATDQVHLSWKSSAEEAKIQVQTITGAVVFEKLVRTIQSTKADMNIDLNNIPSGTYIIEVKEKEKVTRRKLIVD